MSAAALAKMATEINRLRAEVERLNGWKAEAIAVITEWDACYDAAVAAGHPAPLGASKARHVRQLLADPEHFRREVIRALRAEVERLQMRLFEDVTAARIELLTEVQALRAEAKRMRPVIEAAQVWDRDLPNGNGIRKSEWGLHDAVVDFAVAALDAGEPQP